MTPAAEPVEASGTDEKRPRPVADPDPPAPAAGPSARMDMDGLGTRLKELRKRAGLSLRELARQAGVSPSLVSQIENGKSRPSVSTLYAFAQLLDVPIDELFEVDASALANVPVEEAGGSSYDPANAWHPSEYATRISVVHPTHRARLQMAEGVEWERLAATPERDVNFMKITYAPGAASAEGGGVTHDGYEYGYVLSGVLEVTVGHEVFVLHEGESLGFDSTIPHVFRNIGDTEFQGIWFVHGNRH
ncbi:helix-turn-helix domain-containing protein [Microtetraspora fusca]|uniref:Helix-turn-helix domain-containing protein n=1 Tax=Microtetraspora fusca TaxID=1997 RepID=A0ABW6VB39_MICFU